MSQSAETSLIMRLAQPFQVFWLSVRRFVFHLTLRYRAVSPQLRVEDRDHESKNLPVKHGASASRSHAVWTKSSSEPTELNSERSMHADHSETVGAQTPPLGTQSDSAVAAKTTSRLLAQPGFSFRTRTGSAATTRTDHMDESEAEDEEAGWVTAFFGPASARRNLWMFVGSTGIVGLILAIILLFNGNPPQEARIATQPNAGLDEEEPVEKESIEKEPEVPPFVEVKPEPPPFVEPEPEPEPEPEVIVEVIPEPEPEPEPPPIVDDIGVEVILLPAPNEDQGEQFEVKAGDEPLDPTAGFADLTQTDWQKADLLTKRSTDAWSELQKLVPLEPYGPQDTVAAPAINKSGFTASFVTTQPRKSTQSLLMPYELTVTNTGNSKLDRLVMEQTLPESLALHDTTAVHAAGNRKLRWEYEGLQPKDQWNIPVVTVPTQQGQLTLPTTLSIGNSVSSQTLVQTPDIKLVMICRPAAKYKKYHQIVFKITNTGDMPLHNLLMDVQLTGNLWHRFGQDFEFFHKQLDVGKTREALLHVKTEQLGGAQLQAALDTDEGASATARCQFTIEGNGDIESRTLPTRPATETSREAAPTKKDRQWETRPESEPRLVPDAQDPFALPASPKPRPKPIAKPVSQPKTLIEAIEELPVEKPAIVEESPPKKPAPKPADSVPGGFPGGFGPLPERKPVVPPRQPLETESTKESPFDRPVEKRSLEERSEEETSDEQEVPEEDPFAPEKDDPGNFFGDE